jgi:hypothetical protein
MEWILYDEGNDNLIYRLKYYNNFLSWKSIFDLVNINKSFVQSLINILYSNRFDEYYLEFSPVSFLTLDSTVFEFVIIKTSGFGNKAQIDTFKLNDLKTNSNEIKVFPNLSGDSILISPYCSETKFINDYIHIGKFIKSLINSEQKNKLFDTMFAVYKKELEKTPNKNLWLSTHGKGVAWLHLRIDPIPKYISWQKYR